MEQRQSVARQLAWSMASLAIAASVPAIVRRLSRSVSPGRRLALGAAMGAGIALLWFPYSKSIQLEKEVPTHDKAY